MNCQARNDAIHGSILFHAAVEDGFLKKTHLFSFVLSLFSLLLPYRSAICPTVSIAKNQRVFKNLASKLFTRSKPHTFFQQCIIIQQYITVYTPNGQLNQAKRGPFLPKITPNYQNVMKVSAFANIVFLLKKQEISTICREQIGKPEYGKTPKEGEIPTKNHSVPYFGSQMYLWGNISGLSLRKPP